MPSQATAQCRTRDRRFSRSSKKTCTPMHIQIAGKTVLSDQCARGSPFFPEPADSEKRKRRSSAENGAAALACTDRTARTASAGLSDSASLPALPTPHKHSRPALPSALPSSASGESFPPMGLDWAPSVPARPPFRFPASFVFSGFREKKHFHGMDRRREAD